MWAVVSGSRLVGTWGSNGSDDNGGVWTLKLRTSTSKIARGQK